MKRLLFILSCWFAIHAVLAQDQPLVITDDMLNSEYCQYLDSAATERFLNEDYAAAWWLKSTQAEILLRMKGEKDKEYISCLGMQARILYRLGKIDETVDMAQKTVTLWGANVGTDDENYAIFLDNLSLYQAKAGKVEQALDNGKKALKVYEDLLKNDGDLAAILIHCAEYCHDLALFDEAIKYQLRALSIIKELGGELSDDYINELEYLKLYYTAKGDSKNVEKLESRLASLRERAKDRFNLKELATAEGCREHRHEALACAKYLLSTAVDDPQHKAVSTYLMTWSTNTADVSIDIDERLAGVMKTRTDITYYVTAFLAASVEYCLENKVKTLDAEAYLSVIRKLMAYYEANREKTGKNDQLESWLDADVKGSLKEMLERK
jgi:tetratricopeptide (TPR) repeat protein